MYFAAFCGVRVFARKQEDYHESQIICQTDLRIMQSGQKKRKDTHNLRKSQAQASAGVNMPFGMFTARLDSPGESGRG